MEIASSLKDRNQQDIQMNSFYYMETINIRVPRMGTYGMEIPATKEDRKKVICLYKVQTH
ncbi:hypothetical protein CHU92_06250 [Flavobacterium cyanobacteriorum]|uniref:Uncharacterized protein n=1 Tax=Flavobacterium cyanobacteriorum TaxID=2022802 RepID=A0A255Z9N8_9FLAO|nr:hypothetical protein CHU92_06250 [Flavobacterium cyanobacteriorum]